MPSLLLSSRVANAELERAASTIGWTARTLTAWRVAPDAFARPIAAYGEPLFVETIAQQLQLALLAPSHDWITRLPDELRRRRVALTSLRAARALDAPTFVKPVHDKVFRAGIYSPDLPLPVHPTLSEQSAVLISEPVCWLREFRFFVIHGQPAAGSSYLSQGNLAQRSDGTWPADGLADAESFARDVCRAAAPYSPAAYVLDVGELECGDWAVVESNPAWGSGMCGCDPVAALRCVVRACGVTG